MMFTIGNITHVQYTRTDSVRWSVGALERWSDGAMERWSDGAMERWSDEGLEWWSDGVMEWWSDGVTEWRSDGAMQWWSDGVMEWWSDRVTVIIVIVLFIAPYSPKGGIGLNTTKVWTLTNKMQNDVYHRQHHTCPIHPHWFGPHFWFTVRTDRKSSHEPWTPFIRSAHFFQFARLASN